MMLNAHELQLTLIPFLMTSEGSSDPQHAAASAAMTRSMFRKLMIHKQISSN